MNTACEKCGGRTETGVATAEGLIFQVMIPIEKARLLFVVPGVPTSVNPLRAFKQGLSDEPATRGFRIEGSRCTACGHLAFFATQEAPLP